ncbi:hypothetical protein [Pelagibius marinus]|uniref:hypothetical protein n=1 Tax=Pelagibius marinus TaxID=2762760 RepID=UPI00187240C0|nr:hypothetical protein [Pelagibius marinus]
MPPSLRRLSDLSPHNYVAVYCGNWRCPKHSAATILDIEVTIARYGDLPLLDLGARFRCQACGHRPAEIRIGWGLPEDQARSWVNVSEG